MMKPNRLDCKVHVTRQKNCHLWKCIDKVNLQLVHTTQLVFNFWNMHTTFRIGKAEMAVIDNTDGVETFDFFTEYRCRIGIGKAFDTAKVKERVMKNLEATPIEIKEPGENSCM